MKRDQFYKELLMLTERFNSSAPELEVTIRDPEIGLEGYIVVWNTGIAEGGPLGRIAKGGTRISPTLTLDEIKMLSRKMALKNAAADLPLGGAKSGIRANPDETGFEKKYRRFVELSKSFLKENGGIFGGFGFDIGGKPEHALWCCDQLKSTKSFTGKPPHLGGTDYDKEGVAGIGVAEAARTLLELSGDSIKGKTCAIQGMGYVGSAVFSNLLGFGAKIKYLSDLRLGGTYEFEDKIPEDLVPLLSQLKFKEAKELLAAVGCKMHPVNEVLYRDVDILFPCATQNVIRIENVAKLQCRYLVEGANGPSTKQARAHCFGKGIKVIPDFIANPGGTIAAYVELLYAYQDDKTSNRNIVEEAKKTTREKIYKNIQEMMRLVKDIDIEPAHAGRYIALKKLYQA